MCKANVGWGTEIDLDVKWNIDLDVCPSTWPARYTESRTDTFGPLTHSAKPPVRIPSGLQAKEEMDRLYAIVRHAGYVVLLCNTQGIAIHHRTELPLSQLSDFLTKAIWLDTSADRQV